MKPLAECKLYTFIDTTYLRDRPPEAVAQQLCDGGADLIQLRAKGLRAEAIRRMAENILPVVHQHKIGLVINDHLDVAQQVGADLCHLGQEDFFGAGFTQVSQLSTCGSQGRIGLSTHTPAQAERAMAAGPDYIAVGPVFATPTKPAAKPVTLEFVRWAANNVKIPWFAIGGINLENLGEVLDAGARRICVVSAILNAKDVAKTCAEFRRRL